MERSAMTDTKTGMERSVMTEKSGQWNAMTDTTHKTVIVLYSLFMSVIALRSIPAFVLGCGRIRILFEMILHQINTLYCHVVSTSFLPSRQIRLCVNALLLSP